MKNSDLNIKAVCSRIILCVCFCRRSVDTVVSELDDLCTSLLMLVKVKQDDPEHILMFVFL